MAMSEKRKTGFAPHRSPVTIHFSPSEENAPGVTRTPDRRIRNPLLYPAELRALIIGKSGWHKRFFAFFTVLFCGRPCETAQTDENMGKNAAPKSHLP